MIGVEDFSFFARYINHRVDTIITWIVYYIKLTPSHTKQRVVPPSRHWRRIV
ncbi:hypothetical protein HanIR_Chr04g0151071 [Helianthus annuus]|nr:hypothetical protein HanIR_Chr04g0151071 [Helianthus annuus]